MIWRTSCNEWFFRDPLINEKSATPLPKGYHGETGVDFGDWMLTIGYGSGVKCALTILLRHIAFR